MERTRRQRPANNSTGGHSFSTTVCRAANQLQRFCGSTRHRGGCYRSTSSWLPSLFLPLLVRGNSRSKKRKYRTYFFLTQLTKREIGFGCIDLLLSPIAIARQNNTTLQLYYRVYRWSCLTRPSVPEMKYRSSTGENSSRPEREWSTCIFFGISSQQIMLDCKASKRGVGSTITFSLYANHHATLQKKRREVEEVGHEQVCCSRKRIRKKNRERSAKHMKACEFVNVCVCVSVLHPKGHHSVQLTSHNQ